MLKTITPRDYQKPIPEIVFNYFRVNKDKHPLIALPTGAGKTVVIADVIDKILENWRNTKIIVLSHVKEILEQDYNMLSSQLDYDIGINSSGLGKRDTHKDILVAGIQSVYKEPERFKHYNLAIIDEAHLIPPTGNGMYQKFLYGIDAKMLGLTATPYRLGHGRIYGSKPDKIFDDLVYDLTSFENFNKLVDEGYLCKLRTQSTKLKLDANDVPMSGGDYIEKALSQKFDVPSITNAAIEEIIKAGQNYKKWLIFAIDIEHAEHIAERLMHSGIPTGVIHSKMEMNRDKILELYRNDILRCIVNVNVLTTGFDHPGIDLIGLLRPTCSPVIHVQTVGRGLRIAENKDHCLVLDFAGNTARLGPINDIHIKEKGKKGEGGEPIIKTCPNCETMHHPSVRVCDVCGHKFEFKVKISAEASGADIVKTSRYEWHDVDDVIYSLNKKKNAPPSITVQYRCGIKIIKEWICLEHKGYAGHKARSWVKFRYPDVTERELNACEELLGSTEYIQKPIAIKVDYTNKYPSICDYRFEKYI